MMEAPVMEDIFNNVTGYYNVTIEQDRPYWLDVLDKASAIIMTFNLVVLMMGMGAATYWKEVVYNLKRPWGCLLGLACQFLILPATGFGLSKLLHLDGYQSIGVLIMSCSPGGAVSNFFTYWVDGDLALSIVMTAISSLVAFGAMPLNLWIYSTVLNDLPTNIQVPYINILISMFFVTVPAIVGMIIRNYSRVWADRISKLCVVLGWVGVIIVGIFLILLYWETMFSTELSLIICAIAMPLFAITVAFLISKIVCFSNKVSRTIAIETACQNAVVALNVILLSFPDILIRERMIIFPTLYAIFQILQVLILIFIFQIHKYVHRDDVTEERVKSVVDTTLLTHVAMPTKKGGQSNDIIGKDIELEEQQIEKEAELAAISKIDDVIQEAGQSRRSSGSSDSSIEDISLVPTYEGRPNEPPDRFANYLYVPTDQETIEESDSSSSSYWTLPYEPSHEGGYSRSSTDSDKPTNSDVDIARPELKHRTKNRNEIYHQNIYSDLYEAQTLRLSGPEESPATKENYQSTSGTTDSNSREQYKQDRKLYEDHLNKELNQKLLLDQQNTREQGIETTSIKYRQKRPRKKRRYVEYSNIPPRREERNIFLPNKAYVDEAAADNAAKQRKISTHESYSPENSYIVQDTSKSVQKLRDGHSTADSKCGLMGAAGSSALNDGDVNNLNYERTNKWEADARRKLPHQFYFARNIRPTADTDEDDYAALSPFTPRSPSLNHGYQFKTFSMKQKYDQRDYD